MQVGIAATTITPDEPVYMAGFASRTEPSDGAYADLEAAAVVFENGDTRVGILAVDLVGVDEFFLEPLRAAAKEVGIAADGLLVNCSHTHCGPACRVTRGSCRQFAEDYLGNVVAKLCRLLRDAVADLRESVLEYAVGSCTMGINRRRLADGGSEVHMLPNPCKPTDTDVPVLRVQTPDGQVRAVLFSYACHPTTMGGQQIGPDYPGPARDLLRTAVPGCVPVFLQGCGGDVKPRCIDPVRRTFAPGTVPRVRELGRELGRAVEAVLCGDLDALGSELDSASCLAHLPTVGTPDESQLTALAAGGTWERAWAEAVRKTIAEKGGLAKTLPVEVQVLRIGGLCIAAMGGEISCEIGIELKQRFADLKLWTLGYSNLLRSYVASLDAHSEGGYEVERAFLYSLTPEPRPLGYRPESVKVLVDAVADQVKALAPPS